MDIFESNILNLLETPIQLRNQAADAIFYDITKLTLTEYRSLTTWFDRKGAIVVVSPSGSKRDDTIRQYGNALNFLLKEGDSVEAIAIAGVGSSVLGTAALARNVADATKSDVAGIVSGYGMADVVLEALGGWYFYGKIDQFRLEMEDATANVKAILSKTFAKEGDAKQSLPYFSSPLDAYVPSNPDVSALHDILFARYFRMMPKLRLLVGHSKGNLLISSALNHMNYDLENVKRTTTKDRRDDRFNNLAVVTLGAVVNLPGLILPANQHQFLGSLDLLGRMNSRSIGGNVEGATMIRRAGHHLNSKIPCFMDVSEVISDKYVKLPDFPADEGVNDGVGARRRNLFAAAA